MGISDHNKKSSSRRPGSCRVSAHVARRGPAAPARATPVRTVRIRPLPVRTPPSRKQRAVPTRAPRTHVTQTRRASSHEAYTAHGDRSGCTVYCYFCYCCYCCCLTLLSFSLLLLLSPPPNAPASDSLSTLSPNTSLPPSLSTSFPRPLTSCFADGNRTSSAVPPWLTYGDSSPFFYISSRDLAAPPHHLTSSHHGSSSTSTSSSPLLPSRHPLLCRPWPSSRSLSSLLLCPPSFGDPVLSYASTLEHIPSGPARPRTLLRQQSLQQPLIRPPGPGLVHPPTTSQSLGQLHTAPGQPGGGGGGAGKGEGGNNSGEGGGGAATRGSVRGARGSPAGAGASRYRGGGAGSRSRSNPGSWDYMMDQIRNRGLDVKSFL